MRRLGRLLYAGLAAALWCAALAGCALGPQVLQNNRLLYNEAIKRTTEEQLLLNIVRLRYIDNPSSLGVTSIAAQNEIVKSLKMIPFAGSAGGASSSISGFSTLLPQAEFNSADRPTISMTPLDDQEFSRRLFTPVPLEGIVYLSKTTWPIATVFRLYLENINWVSNAETASGPTPREAPVYADYRRGMELLQRLQDRKVISFFSEEREEKTSEGLPTSRLSGNEVLEAAKAGYEFRKDEKKDTWTLIKKRQQAVLRVDARDAKDPELHEFCRIFHLKPGMSSYELVADKADPFLADAPKEGLPYLDLETRSLLQVLFFISHGIDGPLEHLQGGQAPLTMEADGRAFDWNQVTEGLFTVHSCKSKRRPANACVAICYQGYWFYIDSRDRDTKATFALLMQLARIELTTKSGTSPVLTLPLGGR